MAIPSHKQSRELTIQAFEPLVQGTALVDDSLGTQVNRYTQTLQALGGYWSASFTINDRQGIVEDWLSGGLMRDIRVFNPALSLIWKGFVNQITIRLGGLQVVRGPLLDVGNNVAVTFSTVDTSVSPPVIGVRRTTTFASDADSQNLYGELTTVLSTGGVSTTEVDQIRDVFLEENKEPQTSQQLTVGRRSQDISVTIDCLGYAHLLKKYIYNQTAVSGTDDIDDVLIAILAADPNGIISTDTSLIVTNSSQVKAYLNNNDDAWKLVQGLVARGDSSNNRYVFGIYGDNQRAEYNAIPSTVAYQQRLHDPAQRIETPSGVEVEPWNVLPARWLFTPDFLIGEVPPTDLRLDPRMMFLETVSFTAPRTLVLKGGKTDKLTQKIAKLGLGGVGAGV